MGKLWSIIKDIPVASQIASAGEGFYDIGTGNWGEAARDFGNTVNPAAGLYNLDGSGAIPAAGKGLGEAYQYAKDGITAPYNDKRRGIESIQQRLEALKRERLARMDEVYGKADSKYDDTRAAMKQIYGDPRSWSL